MTEPANGRVRVTGPRAGRPRRASIAAEIDAHTELGEVYMRSLIRSQLRLGGTILLAVALTIGLLPLAFHAFPGFAAARVGDVPMPWLVLGCGVYPWLIVLARVYVRIAEANERAFNDLVDTR